MSSDWSPHMFPYSIRNEFADGRTVEFVPTAVRPLGLTELRLLSAEPNATITLGFLAENPRIDGNAVAGTAKLDHRMTFPEPMKIYALVANGGWLPVPFVSPSRFLLDRNVVAAFRRLKSGRLFFDEGAYRLWTAFFEQGAGLLNPLPYAFEGSMRRVPTFDEFVGTYEQGVREIEATLPRCQVVRYSAAHYRTAHGQLEAMHARTPREIEFLCEVVPSLVERTSDVKLSAVTDRILTAADRLSVDRQALVVLVALSCLYEDPRSGAPSIGREILKPTKGYASGDAYNAVSDLRHIELAALGHAWVAEGGFALCTCDRALASLWCALAMRDVVETATGPEFTIDISSDLLQRLTDADAISRVGSLLGPAASRDAGRTTG